MCTILKGKEIWTVLSMAIAQRASSRRYESLQFCILNVAISILYVLCPHWFSFLTRSAPSVSVKELLQASNFTANSCSSRTGPTRSRWSSIWRCMRWWEVEKLSIRKSSKISRISSCIQERLDTLRALPRKNPKTAGHDKNMPPILKQFKGAAGRCEDFLGQVILPIWWQASWPLRDRQQRFSIPPRTQSRERSGQSCDIARHGHRLLEFWRTQDAADKDAADKDLEDAADKAKYLGDLRVKFLAALEKEHCFNTIWILI